MHQCVRYQQTKPKKPGFSFKLAMGCVRAIAQKVIVTIELLINSKTHITDDSQPPKEASQDIQEAIAVGHVLPDQDSHPITVRIPP